MNINNLPNYRYTIKFSKPVDVKTGISWEDLIDAIISKNDVSQVKTICFHLPDSPNGYSHIGGAEMLVLWKQVVRKGQSNPLA